MRHARRGEEGIRRRERRARGVGGGARERGGEVELGVELVEARAAAGGGGGRAGVFGHGGRKYRGICAGYPAKDVVALKTREPTEEWHDDVRG